MWLIVVSINIGELGIFSKTNISKLHNPIKPKGSKDEKNAVSISIKLELHEKSHSFCKEIGYQK